MNYLAHHAVALATLGSGEDPEFYAGNVLPDLVGTSGIARLRSVGADAEAHDPLRRGIRLHLDTDRRFHQRESFARAQAIAKQLFQETEWPSPPQRVFFLTHAAVEITLDRLLLRSDRALADDFYARLAGADWLSIFAAIPILTGKPDVAILPLAGTVQRFLESRYLYRYETAGGLYEALVMLGRRADPTLGAFAESPAGRAALESLLERLTDRLEPLQTALLREPDDTSSVVR